MAHLDGDVPPPMTSAATGACGSRPCLYTTGFEADEDFAPGDVVNQPAGAAPYDLWATGCGGTTASNVDTVNPATGAQHIRLAVDPAKDPGPFGCVVAARVPSSANALANPVNFNVVTISVDMAMTPDGGDYNVQAQTVSQGCLSSRTLFLYYGLTVLLDDLGDGVTFVSAGNWDTSGAYQNFTIRFDPCTPEVTYYYGGKEIYNSTDAGSVIGGVLGDQIDQLLFYHDNLPGSRMDIDNVRIERAPGQCPTTCGANGIEDWVEQCEIPSEGGDDNCPGRCVPPGETGPNGEPECTCVISCPDPCNACELENDVEVSEISTGAWFTFVASAPA